MKQKLERRLEVASARLKEAGKKALQHPIASILSLCMLSGVAATIVTYSQTPEAPVEAAVAMKLPADNVELVDVNGRKITVTVISMAADKQSIVIRTADGKEMPILMSRFNADTVKKLTGRAPQIAPVQPPKPRLSTGELWAKASPGIKAVKNLPAGELVRLYQTSDPRIQPHMDVIKHTQSEYLGFFNKAPGMANNSISPLALVPEMKPVDGEEKVSLRPEFERVGVKATQQVGDTCSTYSAQHLLQFAYLAAGKTPPTTNALMSLTNTNGVKVPTPYLLRAVGQYNRQMGYPTPRTVAFTGFDPGTDKLFFELVKHQLRNKRAVVGSNFSNSHAIVIVGFHKTADGKTTWEYLDSNRVWEDKGYKTTNTITSGRGSAYSVWFE